MNGMKDADEARRAWDRAGVAGCILLLVAGCGSPRDVGAAGATASPPPPAIVDSALPDLTVAADRLTPAIGVATFAADSCEVQEACVTAPGDRRLLYFNTLVWNVGTADLYFGDPVGNPAYELSPCHGHYHLRGFAAYELLDPTGSVVVSGHKQGFCVQDSESLPGTTTSPKYLGCENQGMQVGWGDLYAADLPCQWIDITDVPPGTYRLGVTANPEGLIPEVSRANNAATVEVVISPP